MVSIEMLNLMLVIFMGKAILMYFLIDFHGITLVLNERFILQRLG
jgi:hypothetical protein